MILLPPEIRKAHLKGRAFDASAPWEDEESKVDGEYELSTIQWPRHETIGFKISGVGPDQIMFPELVKELEVVIHA